MKHQLSIHQVDLLGRTQFSQAWQDIHRQQALTAWKILASRGLVFHKLDNAFYFLSLLDDYYRSTSHHDTELLIAIAQDMDKIKTEDEAAAWDLSEIIPGDVDSDGIHQGLTYE